MIILGIDGFGGAYLRNFSNQLPALQTFFDYGAYTTRSRNLAPTVSTENAGFVSTMACNAKYIFFIAAQRAKLGGIFDKYGSDSVGGVQ